MTANPGQPSRNQPRPCPIENTVNGGLTPKRGRPVTENSEYAAFARRILQAYSRRVATADVESLAHMIRLSADLDNAIQLRVTRQAAQQRWGRRSSERS